MSTESQGRWQDVMPALPVDGMGVPVLFEGEMWLVLPHDPPYGPSLTRCKNPQILRLGVPGPFVPHLDDSQGFAFALRWLRSQRTQWPASQRSPAILLIRWVEGNEDDLDRLALALACREVVDG